MRLLMPVALAALLPAACAPVADVGIAPDRSPSARPCFSISRVDNFRQGRSGQVFLRVARREIYELDGVGGCMDLDFANSLVLLPDGLPVGERLCVGDRARILTPASTAHTGVCHTRVIRRLTPEEVAALPANQRP